MKELIKVIAFDADDTLWSNEPFFQEIEKQYVFLLQSYDTPENISAALFQTEMNNLKYLGYGAKAFTISMIETALRVSRQQIPAADIRHKTEKEYLRMLNILQIAPSELVMVGNSLKSDIQPVLSLGGYGIHIPFDVMWKHEIVDAFSHKRLKQIKRFGELLTEILSV